jgi:DNA-binding winged helix-turn-helix (wHTH) protein/Tol biopolymer transport system component
VNRQIDAEFNDMGSGVGRVLNSGPVASGNVPGNGESRTRRFGVFELDLRARELRRNGLKVKLQEQPFQVLSLLLEQPGEIVTREDLRNRLWPADTFVDFDHSLNAAIKRLRDALGDSADNPAFVETVARRGYRFLAPVTVPANGAQASAPEVTAETTVRRAKPFHFWWIAGGAGALVLLLLGIKLGLSLASHHATLQPPRISQLTANPADDHVRAAAISRDGKYLAFSDETGFYLRQIDTGETHPVTLPEGMHAESISWFPDSVHMVVALTRNLRESSLWEISALGGSARTINDGGRSPAVSPDGREVAFIIGKHISQQVWLVDSDGAHPHKLTGEEGDFFGALAWSPDSTRLAVTRGRVTYGYGINARIDVIEVHSQHVTATPVTVNRSMQTALDSPLAWSDNHLIYTLTEPPPHPQDSNLWTVGVDLEGRQIGTPVRITADTGRVFSISTTADGTRVAYLKGIPQPDVYVARLIGSSVISEPQRLTLDDRQDFPYDWTPDGKEVIFTSDRTGTLSIYKQAIDRTVPDMLVRGIRPLVESRLSPDGTQLLYVEYPQWGEIVSSSPLMRVPLTGGTPQKILEASWISNHQCARAPATTCLYSVVTNRTLTFFTYNPFQGEGTQAFQIQDDFPQMYNWSLSPDGATLAIAKGKSEEDPKIRLVSLKGGRQRWLNIQGWPGIGSLDWAADSKSLWVSSAGEEENALLHIDLQGNATAVWRPKKMTVGWAIPSRDGRYLALHVRSTSANVWMLERP